MRLLLVEDDPMIGAAVAEGLREDSHAVDWVKDGLAGARALDAGTPYALLLDLGLPGRDGLKLLADLRTRGDKVPVLVLTARDMVRDRIAGLDAGADDCLFKPFDLDELVARVRALLRRAAGRRRHVVRLGAVPVGARLRRRHQQWLRGLLPANGLPDRRRAPGRRRPRAGQHDAARAAAQVRVVPPVGA